MTDNILTFCAHYAAGLARRYRSFVLHDQSSLSGLQRCGVAMSKNFRPTRPGQSLNLATRGRALESKLEDRKCVVARYSLDMSCQVR